MKKLSYLVVLAGVLAVGCGGGDSKTVVTADGSTVTTTDKGTSIKTSDGKSATLNATGVSEADLGVPFYPGSTPVEGRDMKMDADGKLVVSSVRSTSDAPEKVVEFFKDKVGKEGTTMMSGKMGMATGKTTDGGEIAVTAIPKDAITEITVTIARPKK